MENIFGISTVSNDDARRVEALKRYNLLNTPPEKSFDNIAKLATQFFNLPVGLISFVDTENVFLKANIGVEEIRNTPRNTSICSMALLTDDVTVLEDIPNQDQGYLTDPLLAGELGFKFYAGAPLITHDGFRIGTICVIGKEPRNFSDREKEMLKSMARIVMDEIELRMLGAFEAEQRILEAADQARRNYNSYTMFAKAPVAIAILTGRELIVELANAKILQAWRKKEDIIGKPLKVVLPELDGQPFLQILDDVFTSGVPYFASETPAALRLDGELHDIYFNFVYQPLKDPSGKTLSIMIVASDITDQIVARKLIEMREKKMENLIMNSSVGMCIFAGKELIIESANQPMLDMWEKTEEEIMGKSLLKLFNNKVNDAFPAPLLSIFDGHETLSFDEVETEFDTAKGIKILYLKIQYTPIFDVEGNVDNIIATISDITEIVKTRKFLEQIHLFHQTANQILVKTIEDLSATNKEILLSHGELALPYEDLTATLGGLHLDESSFHYLLAKVSDNLQKAEDNFRSAVNSANVGTWHITVDTMQFVNTSGLKKLFGYHADEVMTFAQAIAQILPEYRDQVLTAVDDTINNGAPYGIEYPAIGFHDKKVRWLRAFGRLNKSADGTSAYFSGVAFEINERRAEIL